MSCGKNGETVRLDMWIVLLIISILVLLYIILIIAPSVVAYITVFGRMNTTPLNERRSLSYYEPYVDKIKSSMAYLSELNKRTVRIESYDGIKLRGELYDGSLPKTAICVHGYASGPDYNFAVQGEFLHKLGFNLLFIHQRAHDDSGGKHICFGLKEQYDLIKWVQKATELNNTGALIVYGISMGAATTAYASDKLDANIVKAMIIDCGFTSPYDQIKHDLLIRHLPWRLMLPIIGLLTKTILKINIKKPVSDSLKETKIPAFFIHGEVDTTVKVEQGKTNYNACACEKQLAVVKGGKHTVSFLAGGESIQNKLKNFLNKYCKE